MRRVGLGECKGDFATTVRPRQQCGVYFLETWRTHGGNGSCVASPLRWGLAASWLALLVSHQRGSIAVGRWISSVRVAAVGVYRSGVADPFAQKKRATVPSISEEAAKPNHIRTAHHRNSGIWT